MLICSSQRALSQVYSLFTDGTVNVVFYVKQLGGTWAVAGVQLRRDWPIIQPNEGSVTLTVLLLYMLQLFQNTKFKRRFTTQEKCDRLNSQKKKR